MVITHERGLFANPPNILIVYGDELLKGNYRENLRDYLYKSPSAPIGKGTHDFWITYGSGGSPNHSWEDMSITPRPMRGIVEMGAIPIALDPPSIRMHLSVLTQEISHQWLVPTDLSIKHEDFWPSTSSRPYKIPYADETALSLQEGTPLYGPPLLGREDIHWSAFFQSDQSVQDGVSWTDIGEEGGHRIWRQKYIAQPVVQPAGLARLKLRDRFNDLDLFIMGVKSAAEAYASSDNKFQWFEPVLTSPLWYHAGLCIAFSKQDFFYFGFYEDHRKLGITRTGSPSGVPEHVSPLPNYHPLRDVFNSIALRIVRNGDNYYFQARLYHPAAGGGLLENIDPPPPLGGHLSDKSFRTLAIFTHTSEPKAMGLIVKTWADGIVCDAAFRNVAILDGSPSSGSESILRTDKIPPNWDYSPSSGYDTLPLGSLVLNRPAKQAGVRIGRGMLHNEWLHLNTPYKDTNISYDLDHPNGFYGNNLDYDHNPSVDRAPKVLTKTPGSHEFAVATVARINRSSFNPWAGDGARGMTMWGRPKSAKIDAVVLPDHSLKKQSLPDPDGTYKIAFIVVASRRSDISSAALSTVDTIRSYWDAAFEALTLGRRKSASSLP